MFASCGVRQIASATAQHTCLCAGKPVGETTPGYEQILAPKAAGIKCVVKCPNNVSELATEIWRHGVDLKTV